MEVVIRYYVNLVETLSGIVGGTGVSSYFL